MSETKGQGFAPVLLPRWDELSDLKHPFCFLGSASAKIPSQKPEPGIESREADVGQRHCSKCLNSQVSPNFMMYARASFHSVITTDEKRKRYYQHPYKGLVRAEILNFPYFQEYRECWFVAESAFSKVHFSVNRREEKSTERRKQFENLA